MPSRAGLKRVIKTVRTKKGVKRQTFWVKASPDAKSEKKTSRGGRLGKAALAVGALAIAGYGAHRASKHLKSKTSSGASDFLGRHAGHLVGAAAALAGGGKANRASFARHGVFGDLSHESGRVARPVTFGS